MERGQKVLALTIVFLALSILVGCYWISRSIENSVTSNSNSIVQASQNITSYMSRANTSQNDILNQAQAANYLQITEDRLFKVIDAIPHVRLGGQDIFSKKALSDWVEKSNFSSDVN
ncbi:helix-turn-helix domain-containing protein [Desulfosporosinus sp. OT]|uniref:helix-turn-helix domain-containing protein n=1 Tax=Desulfosporosinus sp. OT TaxID=913865 RepID=UPI000223ABFB|nr:helix-turn-helix domain-containing protein [Desulfosporosinus sp. OT]EGW39753.1 putative lipoprotein [Desulfosporosinus sp. OT]